MYHIYLSYELFIIYNMIFIIYVFIIGDKIKYVALFFSVFYTEGQLSMVTSLDDLLIVDDLGPAF